MFIDNNKVMDKVRNIIDNPAYIVLGGSRMAGIKHPKIPYLIKGFHITSTLPAIGDGKVPAPEKPADFHRKYSSKVTIHFVIYEIQEYISQLKSRNISTIEELHSPIVFFQDKCAVELKKVSSKLLTRELYPGYLNMIQDQTMLLSEQNPKEIRSILELYRLYMEALYLFRLGKMVPNLQRLNDYFSSKLVNELIDRINFNGEQFYNENIMEIIHDINELKNELESSCKYSILPDKSDDIDDLLDIYLKRSRKKYRHGTKINCTPG